MKKTIKIGDAIPDFIQSKQELAKVQNAKISQINTSQLWKLFKKKFQIIQDKEFIETETSINNIKSVFYYFLNEDEFFELPNVKSELSKPSFKKGLLIIGGYGVGKTSSMRAMEECFQLYNFHRFKYYNTNQVVQLYEQCISPLDKITFYNRMNLGVTLFDDLTTEKIASNFGLVNTMKYILEQRYSLQKLTHVITNFKEGHPNNVDAALENLGEVYGSRVYDRLFDMFNIVVFDGKSFRR